MMRWVVFAIAALAVVVLLVAVVGAMLPKQHTVSRSARLPLPPDALFRLLIGMKFGDVPVRVERQEAPSLLVTRVVEGQPFGGTWTYRIAPAPGGSELTITEDGEVYNVVFRFMSRFVFGHYATLDAYLKDVNTRSMVEGKP
jgi:hypothetical protein